MAVVAVLTSSLIDPEVSTKLIFVGPFIGAVLAEIVVEFAPEIAS
jgi:hypothetical protein